MTYPQLSIATMQELLQIDLEKILSARIPADKLRYIPSGAFRLLERIVHQEELNEMLRACYPREGSAFASALLEHQKIDVEVRGMENIPGEGRFIFASNHPLGGLDGITLISVLGRLYGDERIHFLVNDLLMNVTPLQNVFLPINKYGGQARAASDAINVAYEGDGQVVIFPAGLVSRLQHGEVRDLEWRKTFVSKAVKYGRDVIPVHFDGLNTRRFYRLAQWRKRLGIKVNLEQAMLPAELCRARGAHFRVTFGRPVECATLPASPGEQARAAAALKETVYALKGI